MTVLVYRQKDKTDRSETVSVSFRFRTHCVLSLCFSVQKNTFLSVVDIYNEFNTLVFCFCVSICTILSCKSLSSHRHSLLFLSLCKSYIRAGCW